jgi:hypothetical protein
MHKFDAELLYVLFVLISTLAFHIFITIQRSEPISVQNASVTNASIFGMHMHEALQLQWSGLEIPQGQAVKFISYGRNAWGDGIDQNTKRSLIVVKCSMA